MRVLATEAKRNRRRDQGSGIRGQRSEVRDQKSEDRREIFLWERLSSRDEDVGTPDV